MDYQGNADKVKRQPPDKQIEKVVTGEVVQRPKGIGRKFKDIFLGGDLKTAAGYVVGDVLLPALRNLIVDVTSKGMERIVYGESGFRRRPTEYRSRIQYNQSPLYRDPREIRPRAYLPDQAPYRQNRREIDDVILASRPEADLVVERLMDIIDKYEQATFADYRDLLGLPTSHVDNKWGWTYLNNVEVRQVRDGYVIDLPPLEAVQ